VETSFSPSKKINTRLFSRNQKISSKQFQKKRFEKLIIPKGF